MCRDLCRAIVQGDLERARELIKNGSSVHEPEYMLMIFGAEERSPLQLAHSNAEMTRLLLDSGASLDDSQELDENTKALHMASLGGHVNVVRLYLDIGTHVDLDGDNSGSPLFYATRGAEEGVVRLLLDRGADVNLIAGSEGRRVGRGPLHLACAKGLLNMVRLFLDRGADVNAGIDSYCGSPLSWTFRSGSVEIARLLLARGAEIEENILLFSFCDGGVFDEEYSYYGENVQMDGNDQLELLEFFLDLGVDPNLEDDFNWTVLAHASMEGSVGIVRVLLDRGVGVDGKGTEEAHRPLHEASRYGKEAVARLLIERGADVNAFNNDGQTPLHTALDFEMDVDDNTEIVRLLLNENALVDKTKRETKETALHLASRWCKKQDIIEMLLDRGASVKAKDGSGDTPLHAACESGTLKTIQLLLDRDATPNAANRHGETLLHTVCRRRPERKVAELFLDHGADVHAKDENGKTPLHSMCEMSFDCGWNYFMDWDDRDDSDPVAIVGLLLDRGADPEAKTKDGFTPLQLACQKKKSLGKEDHLELVWLFVRRYPWLVLGQSCPTDDHEERKNKRQRVSS